MPDQNNALQAVRKRIENRIELSADLLKQMGFTPEAYTRVALNALINAPKLAECTTASLDAAIMQCIEIGLLPDSGDRRLSSRSKTRRS